jgi:uncharacterized protein
MGNSKIINFLNITGVILWGLVIFALVETLQKVESSIEKEPQIARGNTDEIIEGPCERLAANPNNSDTRGMGVPYAKLDSKAAIPACKESVMNNPKNARLHYQYARALQKGKQFDEALKWFNLSAGKKYAPAQTSLGVSYYYGEGVSQNFKEAAKWYKLAVGQGDLSAQFNLGVMYEHGKGVAQDYKEAAKLYKFSADQGYAYAQFYMGRVYSLGLGTQKDHKEALKWYQKAAKQNHGDSQFTLGVMYENGSEVPQDYKEALKWYQKAADQRHLRSIHTLSWIYFRGDVGQKKDFVKALMWIDIAFLVSKEKDSGLKRDKVTKELTPAQIAEAEQLAKEWIKNHQGI